MDVMAWAIALGCSVLCNVYLLRGIKIYYEKGKEDGKKEALERIKEKLMEDRNDGGTAKLFHNNGS